MKVMKTMRKQWIAAAALAVILTVAGCNGTGGVGGQGINLEGNTDCRVEINITDGGTGLENPSPAPEKPQPTTRPGG